MEVAEDFHQVQNPVLQLLIVHVDEAEEAMIPREVEVEDNLTLAVEEGEEILELDRHQKVLGEEECQTHCLTVFILRDPFFARSNLCLQFCRKFYFSKKKTRSF